LNILWDNLSCHFYADNTQQYLSFNSSEARSALANLTAATADVLDWVAAHFLKMSDNEASLFFEAFFKGFLTLNFLIPVCSVKVQASLCSGNHGVYFCSALESKIFNQKTAFTSSYHIRSLAAIRYHPLWILRFVRASF